MAVKKIVACACGRWVKVLKDAPATCSCGQTAAGTVRYEVVVDGPMDGATGKRKQLRRRFTTRKEATTWDAQTKVQVEAGTFVGRERITVDAYLDEWLAGLNKQKPSTVANYRHALKPVRRLLGARVLQDVAKAEVQRVVTGMLDGSLRVQGRRGTALSPRAARLTLTVLTMALEAAVQEGRLPRNVAALVERPAGSSPARTSWEPTEVSAFLAVADKDRLAGCWRLSLHGLRRGEVLGLAWADVDLDQGLVRVHRSRVVVDGQTVLQGSTKTDAGTRLVPLSPDAVQALRRTSAQQAQERLAAGPAWFDTGLVAVDGLGQPVKPRWYADRFQALAKEAKVPVTRLHDARHAYGSHLLAQGVPLPLVSQVMGHASVDVTASVYAHALKEGAHDRLREALSAAGL